MRIAQVTCVYPPYRGGIGDVAFEYTKRLISAGHDVEVFTPKYNSVSGAPDYVNRLKPVFKFGNAAFIPQIRRAIARGNFDVVHLHYPFFGAAECLIGIKTPMVITYHMDPVGSGIKNLIFSAHRKFFMRPIMESAKKIFVSTLDYARGSAIYKAVDPNNLLEVPFGIDVNEYCPSQTEKTKNDGEPVKIIFVGGLDKAHYFKGLPVLFQALSEISENWKLIVIGDGELKESFIQNAKDLGIFDRIEFAGRVVDKEKINLYRSADIHVIAAINQCEAFGIVTLEAQACGLPSIVSDLLGVRTVIEPGITGLLAKPADPIDLREKISRLIRDSEMRMRMGAAGRERMKKNYSWDVLIRRIEDAYKIAIQKQL